MARHGSNALDNFMKLNGYPNRAEYGRNYFWTLRLSHLIEPKLNLAYLFLSRREVSSFQRTSNLRR